MLLKLRINAIKFMPHLRYSLRNNFDQLNDILFNSVLPSADLEIRDFTQLSNNLIVFSARSSNILILINELYPICC